MIDYNHFIDSINSLVLYRNIANDQILGLLKDVFSVSDNLPQLAQLIGLLTDEAEERGVGGNIYHNHIINLMLGDENTFTLLCENGVDTKTTSIYKLAQADIAKIRSLAELDLTELPDAEFMHSELAQLMDYKPVNKRKSGKKTYTLPADFTIDDIAAFHKKNGCGDVSLYKAFRYDDKNRVLTGVSHPDPITFEDLIGYKAQTEQLIENTLAFINGYAANNVLLVGARGTGKSSSVKALVNRYFDDGLRLLEITKDQIIELPHILKILRPRGRYFIIYIDDLSFDENEIQYKYMKSLLEGGSEGKPDNVVFYATSNRRHIIQEKWSDRAQGSKDAEIHTADTMNEKLSLSDRFGITITYAKPTPKEYINIVKGIATQRGLEIDEKTLEQEAMKWELNQKGMSGRTAKQFVDNMLWQDRQDRGTKSHTL
jgi:hypothetical protein